MNIISLTRKAKTSKWALALLNYFLNTRIPFNKPHRLKIEEISDEQIVLRLPYRKRNLNHLKGLHACAMATLCEVTSGFFLLSRLDPKRYRLILSKLEMEYHWQAKQSAWASFSLSDEEILALKDKLQEEGKTTISCELKIFDDDYKHLATGTAYWQLKDWQKTKVKA